MAAFSAVADCSFEIEVFMLWEGIPLPSSGTLTSAVSMDVSEEAATEAQYVIKASGQATPEVVTSTTQAHGGFLANAKQVLSKIKGVVPTILEQYIFTKENIKNSPLVREAKNVYDVVSSLGSLFGLSRQHELAVLRLLRAMELTQPEDVEVFDALVERKLVPPAVARVVRSMCDLKVSYAHTKSRRPRCIGVDICGTRCGRPLDAACSEWEIP
jgi:hypothetical protein